MDELVADHSVHALGRDLVVANFHIFFATLIIDGSETAVVFENNFTIWLLGSNFMIVFSLKRLLSWFEHGVWLITATPR